MKKMTPTESLELELSFDLGRNPSHYVSSSLLANALVADNLDGEDRAGWGGRVARISEREVARGNPEILAISLFPR